MKNSFTKAEYDKAQRKSYKKLAYAVLVDYLKDCDRLNKEIKRLENKRDLIGVQNPIFYRREQIKITWAKRKLQFVKKFEQGPVCDCCLGVLGMNSLDFIKKHYRDVVLHEEE